MIIGINGRVGSGKDTVGRIIQYLIRAKQNDGFSDNVKLEDTLNLTLSDPFHSGWQIKKYAAKLKQIASILTGIPVEKFEDQDFKKTYLGKEWSHSAPLDRDAMLQEHKYWEDVQLTVREFLQKLGTEGIRDMVHENAWVNALMADYKPVEWRLVNPADKECSPEEPIPGTGSKWIITDCRFPNEAQAIKDKGGIVIRVTRPGENLADLHPSETSLDSWDFDALIENSGTIAQLKDNVAIFLHKSELL